MKDDTTQIECENLFWRRVGLKLGVEIATARPLSGTPLFDSSVDPPVDRTQRNVFLHGHWDDLLAHLKCAFIRKYHMTGRVEAFSFQIVTDERLKNVYLSNEAYSTKQRKKRDEGETFNALSDLIGNFYQLVVIRLGFLGYKNVAMPGILKEALLLRQGMNLPVWLVEEPESPFGPGHFSWSLEVNEYVGRRFENLDLTQPRDSSSQPQYRGVEGASPFQNEPGMALDSEEILPSKPSPKPKSPPPSEAEAVVFDNDPILMGNGKKNYKKGSRRGGSE